MPLPLRAMAAPVVVAALAASAPARAQLGPLELRAEPGVAFFVTSAQQARYGPVGAELGVRASLPVWSFLWAGVGASFTAFPFPSQGVPAAGALALGLSARANFQPAWVEAALHGVGTGPNFRFGYELGAGGDLAQLGPLKLGPYVRFLHVLQPEVPFQDPSSAMVVSAGLSLSFLVGQPEPTASAPAGGGGKPGGKAPSGPRVVPASQLASGEGLVVLTQDKIQIRAPARFETITFEPGTAQIVRDSFLTLATVAKVIFLHPEIRRVRIEGHTDSVGAREANLELSARRAEAVRKHLVELNGVEADRLEAVGYGPDQPVASNDTAEGRAQNRRVEFVITERANDAGGTPPR